MPLAALFSADCRLTGGPGTIARDLESLDRNMRFSFPHLKELTPLSVQPLWHRSTGWVTGSVGVGIGQHAPIRIQTSGMNGLALYATLSGDIDVRQDGHRYSRQSHGPWMLFNEIPVLADTGANTGVIISIKRPRLQATFDAMTGTTDRPVASRAQILNLMTPAGRRAEHDLPLILQCAADASRRWPESVELAEDLVYRFIAGLLLNPSALPPRYLREVNERHLIDLSCGYMISGIDRAISLTEVEKVVGLGTRVLQSAFRRRLGLSPMRWLREQRLLLAHHLIVRHPDMPVSQVALACGLSHFGRFAGLFQARFGLSPSALARTPRQLH